MSTYNIMKWSSFNSYVIGITNCTLYYNIDCIDVIAIGLTIDNYVLSD